MRTVDIALVEQGLACPLLPRLTAFCCTADVSMIFHALVYITFKQRADMALDDFYLVSHLGNREK